MQNKTQAYQQLKSNTFDLMQIISIIFSLQGSGIVLLILNQYRSELFNQEVQQNISSSFTTMFITIEHISYLWLTGLSAIAGLFFYLALNHIFSSALSPRE